MESKVFVNLDVVLDDVATLSPLFFFFYVSHILPFHLFRIVVFLLILLLLLMIKRKRKRNKHSLCLCLAPALCFLFNQLEIATSLSVIVIDFVPLRRTLLHPSNIGIYFEFQLHIDTDEREIDDI